MKKIDFLGLQASPVSKKEIVDILTDFAVLGCQKTAFYLNAHCVNMSFSDSEYRAILNRADLLYPGGKAVVLASRIFSGSFQERVNILDFFDDLAERLIKKNVTVFLLGNTKQIVEKTEEVLKARGLRVLGSRDGFFSEAEGAEVIRTINSLKPDILMVGMGVPKQEAWIDAHKFELNVHLFWGVGAAFDWLSGTRKMAPAWMVDLCLEWLHRLFQQPKRLWKRYLMGNPIFIYHVIRWKMGHAKED